MTKVDPKDELIAELRARCEAAETEVRHLRQPALRGAPSIEEAERLFSMASTVSLTRGGTLNDFHRCLIWMSWMTATPEPNFAVSTTYFVDKCEEWLRRQGFGAGGNVATGLYPAAACCRVPFVLPVHTRGIVGAIGIATHGGANRIGERWRDVLSGKVMLRGPDAAPERSGDPRAKVGWA